MKVEDKINVFQKYEMKSKRYCERCKKEIDIVHRVIIYTQTPSSISPFDALQFSICGQCRKDLEKFLREVTNE